MNNGQDNAGPSQQLALQLASMLGRDRIVNNEQLTSIMGQVAQARRLLDSIEQEAQNRHSQYQSMVQQLQARVNQGAEAEQLLRRLGTQTQQIQQAQQTQQTQQAAPFVYGANVVQSPQSNGYYFQQHNPQQLSYQAAAAATATASVNVPGPSRLPEQQSSSYAAQVQQQATFTQYQPDPQTTQQPQANQHYRQPTAGGPHGSRHYRDHHRHHVSVQPEAPMVPPPVVQQRHPPVTQQPSRPFQSPQVPPVAFPPLESHGASRRSTVLAAGISANVQKSPTTPSTSSPPARPPQAPQSAASQNATFTQSQLAGITMEIHDLLKPRTREVIESVLPLVMRELHSRGKMGLNPHDIQVVYNWPLDPRIAPEVTPLFLAIVKKLLPLNSAQSSPIIRLILTSLNRRPSVANPNVQQHGSRPATPSTAPTVNGSAPNQPSSSAPLNGTQLVSRPSSAQGSTHPAPPAGAPISEPPTTPMTNGRDQPQTLVGSPFSAVISNGRSDSNHPPTLSVNRPPHTVLNPPPSSQGNLPSTPPAGQRDTPLTPNTKTLARDILRSLGRPRGSLSSNASSQGSPGPSKLRVDQHRPPPASQPSVPAPDQQYREKEIIVIDDDSSVSSRPPFDSMSVDEVSLPEKPVEASLPRPLSPPRRPSPPQQSSSPAEHPPAEQLAPAVPGTVDFDVVEIQTPGAIQMAYEEVQEMLQNGAPTATIDQIIGIPTANVSIPAPSSPRLSSAASPPPQSRSSTPADLVPAPRTPTPEPPPVAGPSKEPLFLASSPPSSSADVEEQMVIKHDEDAQRSTDAFTPTGLLGFGAAPQQAASSLNKGKGRALEVDSDNDDSMPSLTSRRKRQKVDHVLVSDSEVVETSEAGGGARRRRPRTEFKVYVDVPPMSERYERYRRRVEQHEGGDRRKRARPLVVLSSASGSDVEVIEDDEIEESEDEEGRQQRLSEERQAVKLSVSRLRETPCHWRGCRAVLETAERLAEHLQLHASEKTSPPLICDWEDCNRRFSSHEKFVDHLSHHSEAELVCAYANCPVIALTPRELTLHHEKKHNGQRLKRGAGLYKPRLPPLGPLPRTLPAYKSVPLKVLPARISRNQHIWIGSKIAANITCYVHPGSRPNAAAPSRTSRRLADKVAEIERRAQAAGLDPTQAILHMSHGEYDAWLPEYRERGPRSCSNLPSSDVTEMVMKGLVIGAEYLEGDRRVPPEDDEEEDEIEEGSFGDEEHDIGEFEDAQGVGNESDQTIVIEDAFQAAVIKEVEVPDAVMADEHLPEQQADDEVRIEVLQPSSSASIPAAHGDQQDVDMEGDATVDGTRSESENLSLPGWNVLRGDSVDVDGML